MIRLSALILTLSLIWSPVPMRADAIPAKNADEAHAVRLYTQYKTSKQKAAGLEVALHKKQEDLRMVAHGMGGGFAIDPEDVRELTQYKNQLAEERQRMKNLEKAWDKKFYGRYGDLADSSDTIYDAKTKRTMDKIEFRLRYFRYNVNDGKYQGKPTGAAAGNVTFTINGTSITGSISGRYKYTFLDKEYSDPFRGSIQGSVSNDGAINARLSGDIGGSAFTGSLKGNVKGGKGNGTWSAKALITATGGWAAARK